MIALISMIRILIATKIRLMIIMVIIFMMIMIILTMIIRGLNLLDDHITNKSKCYFHSYIDVKMRASASKTMFIKCFVIQTF